MAAAQPRGTRMPGLPMRVPWDATGRSRAIRSITNCSPPKWSRACHGPDVISRRFLGALAFAACGLLPSLGAAQSFDQILKAASEGDVKVVDGLLAKGLDPNTADLQ